MLMTVCPSKVNQLLDKLEAEGVKSSIIGEVTSKDVYLERRGLSYVTPPDSDELYKVVF
jgi:hydrogenase maturation factor